MENSCRKKYKPSPKKWILASSYPEFRRNSALIPANAGLFHYAGNNPVRYIDPDGREDTLSDFEYQKRTKNSPYKQEQWTATEKLTMGGGEMRLGNSGMTMLTGTAKVEFSNGKESFTKDFEVISIYSEGLFFSLGVSETNTVYSKSFNAGVSKEEIINSYEGIFATQGISISVDVLKYFSLSYSSGFTFGVDALTQDYDKYGWQGSTKGASFGFGGFPSIQIKDNFSLNFGTQITVYRDPEKDENEFSNHPEWFFYKPLIIE